MTSFVVHPSRLLRDTLGPKAAAFAFAWKANRDGSGPALTAARLALDTPPLSVPDLDRAAAVLRGWADDFAAASGFILRSLCVEPATACGAGADLDAGLAGAAVEAYLTAFSAEVAAERARRNGAPEFTLEMGDGEGRGFDVCAGFNHYDAHTRSIEAPLIARAQRWRQAAEGLFGGLVLAAFVPVSSQSVHERLEHLISAQSDTPPGS